MDKINGFSPIAQPNAKILILGSMPSETSLQKTQYYGHKQNAFWPIMVSLFAANKDQKLSYTQGKKLLINYKIAVWDVLQSCHRSGSLDSAIKMDSLKTNDFFSFFSSHKHIEKVFFNGGKAESIFYKYVLPSITQPFDYLQYVRLPSTSPAYATMTLKQKTAIWEKEIKANNKDFIG